MTTDTRPDFRLIDPSQIRLLSPDQLATYLSIGRTAAYALVGKSGVLRADTVRVGRSLRIPIDRVDRWIDAGGSDEVRANGR